MRTILLSFWSVPRHPANFTLHLCDKTMNRETYSMPFGKGGEVNSHSVRFEKLNQILSHSIKVNRMQFSLRVSYLILLPKL